MILSTVVILPFLSVEGFGLDNAPAVDDLYANYGLQTLFAATGASSDNNYIADAIDRPSIDDPYLTELFDNYGSYLGGDVGAGMNYLLYLRLCDATDPDSEFNALTCREVFPSSKYPSLDAIKSELRGPLGDGVDKTLIEYQQFWYTGEGSDCESSDPSSVSRARITHERREREEGAVRERRERKKGAARERSERS
jgi:hypothetical protein